MLTSGDELAAGIQEPNVPFEKKDASKGETSLKKQTAIGWKATI